MLETVLVIGYHNGSDSTYIYNLPDLLLANCRLCYFPRGSAEEHEPQSPPPAQFLSFLKSVYLLGILYKASSWADLPVGGWTHEHRRSRHRASYVPVPHFGKWQPGADALLPPCVDLFGLGGPIACLTPNGSVAHFPANRTARVGRQGVNTDSQGT